MEFEKTDFQPGPFDFRNDVVDDGQQIVYTLAATPAGYNIPARSLRIRMTNDFDLYASIVEHWDQAHDD